MPKALVMKLGKEAFDAQEIYPAVHAGRVWIVGGLTSRGETRPQTVSFAIADALTANESVALRNEAALPSPRHHVGLASVGGSLYAIGGMRPGGFELTDACWVLHRDARAWEPIAPLPSARAACVVMDVAGTLLVASGREANGERVPLGNATLRYDAQQDRWYECSGLAHPRDHAAGFVHEGKLYIVGGRRIALSSPVSESEVYDPDRDAWNTLPALALTVPRGGLTATKLGSRVYVVGGELETSALARMDVLDLGQMNWREPESLPIVTEGPSGRHGHGAVALPDGRMLVIGGANTPQVGAVSSAILLDAPEQPR